MLNNISKIKILLLLFFITITAITINAQTLTLQQCIDSAQLYNKSLLISRNNIEISNEKEKEAKANLIPKLKLSGDYKYFIDLPYQLMPQAAFGGPEGKFKEIEFGTPHNVNIGIQAAIPLYNPLIYSAIKTAKVAEELSELQFKKTKEQVIINVSNLYFNAQILKHQLAFIDSNLVNTTRLLKTIKLLKEQLLVKNTDIEKVQLQKAKLIIQHETVFNNLVQVLNLLKLNMGLPSTKNIDVVSKISYTGNIVYPQNPVVDIQLGNKHKDLLYSKLKTLKNSYIPSVSVYGSYNQVGFGYDKKPNNFLKFFPTTFAGIKLSFPLFNGTVTKRKINQTKIELKNSELQLSLLIDQNNIKIENAKRQREVALNTIENTNNEIKLALSVYKQTLLQQKQGLASLADILMADTGLKEAQQDNITAIIKYLKADLELKKLTGNIN